MARPIAGLGLALAVVLSAAAQAPHQAAPRIIVKLRAPLAEQVEASAASSQMREFLTRHAARTLVPLYPHAVEARKLRRVSDRQMALEVRQRFAKRASRFRGTFQPPEISRTYVLDASNGLEETLAGLRADPQVEFAEEDKTVSVNYTPDDPYFSSHGSWGQDYDDLWGIKDIGAPAAWDTSAGEGVVVAVVDTGIDYTHPDIAANIWTNPGEIAGNGIDDDHNGYIDDAQGWDFAYSSNDPFDDNGHGTHLAGTIAAVGGNGIGVIGVAWRSKVMAVKALNSEGRGYDSALASAIVYAADQGADVISNSWGGVGYSQAIADAIDYAYSLGAVIVASAGNSSQDVAGFYPAASPQVIAVAASDTDDAVASFSNWGGKIEVAAPGVDILSLLASNVAFGTTVNDRYTRASGTSMAAPHVAGLAALILAQHPDYSNEDVRQVIRTSAKDLGTAGHDRYYGYGRIDSAAAMTLGHPLQVRITAPAEYFVAQDLIQITGVALGDGFAGYTLDYAVGDTPTTWTVLQSGSTEVAGALGTFDAGAVPNGTYVLRLTARNTAGQAFVDEVQFYVTSYTITSPLVPNAPTSATMYKNGAKVPIEGIAAGRGFEHFQVEWAAGVNPSSGWQSAGMAVTGGGASPVSSGVLAVWDTASITQAGYYTIRLTVVKTAATVEARTVIYLEPDLFSAEWPKFLTRGPAVGAGVLPARSAEGAVQLVAAGSAVGGLPSMFWRLPLAGRPQSTPYIGSGSTCQPAVADFNGDGNDEAAIVDRGEYMWIFGPGTTNYPVFFPISADYRRTQAAIEDLDGDSTWEILALGSDFVNNVAYLAGWRPAGTSRGQALTGNFPIQIGDLNDMRSHPNQRRFLAGDFDADGNMEIAVAEGLSSDTFHLRLFRSDGSPRPWDTPVIDGRLTAMVAADLDHNGKLETILVSHTQDGDELHVIQPDGVERTGWPLMLTAPNDALPLLAVGDLARSGREEIVLAHQTGLYVFRDDGTPFPGAWPVRADSASFSAAVIGDIDGDGLPEIVTARRVSATTGDPFFAMPKYIDQTLFAFHADGTVAKSWQLTGMNGDDLGSDAVPTLGDFDQDGTTEIAIAYGVTSHAQPGPGVVSILKTGGAFHASANDWPMLYHDARNTAVRAVVQIAGAPPKITSIVNAASLAAGPVAPGELVEVLGSALGRGEALGYRSTPPTTLGGASVLFDATPAPLVYARDDRLYAVVPSSVAGKTSVQVQVERSSGQSDPATVVVAATAPGLFTMNEQGTGPGAILNQDGSLNGPTAWAARNSVVSLFATGAGLITVRPRIGGVPAAPVAVSIGGQAAEVISAAALDGGILQVDVRVPPGVAGGAVAVVLQIGTVSSQTGVTMAVGP